MPSTKVRNGEEPHEKDVVVVGVGEIDFSLKNYWQNEFLLEVSM